jgi:hypothetical protein
MDMKSAYIRGHMAKDNPHKVFDWDKAARLIREARPGVASAGLSQDWEYCGGVIYRDGKPVSREDADVFLASNWATPELDMEGVIQDCWRFEADTPGWDAHTYWPESALAILGGEVGPSDRGGST